MEIKVGEHRFWTWYYHVAILKKNFPKLISGIEEKAKWLKFIIFKPANNNKLHYP
jgi:hypothetical protein